MRRRIFIFSAGRVHIAPASRIRSFSVTKLSGRTKVSASSNMHNGWSIAVVTVDRAQQRTDALGSTIAARAWPLESQVHHAGLVLDRDQHGGGNREPEYHSATASQAACGLITASRFDSTQRNQHFRCGNLGYRPIAISGYANSNSHRVFSSVVDALPRDSSVQQIFRDSAKRIAARVRAASLSSLRW